MERLLLTISRWLDMRGSTRIISSTEVSEDGHTLVEYPYLKRHYLLKTPWFAVFLHRFFRSDRDDPHDHPWASVSIPLFPGFFECVYGDETGIYGDSAYPCVTKWRNPFGIYFRKAKAAHVISVAKGFEGRTWSLFIHFKRERDWGFWRYEYIAPINIAPGETVYLDSDGQANAAYQAGAHVDVTPSGWRVTNSYSRGAILSLTGKPGRWKWREFKAYGREILKQNIESGVVPNAEPDFILKGWLLPRLVRP